MNNGAGARSASTDSIIIQIIQRHTLRLTQLWHYHAHTLDPIQNRIHIQPVKPVLNWANVCSPNILRTLRRTMIRFLIELLVRRIRFGQSKLYFVLNWLVMRCKLRPELAADAHDRKCRLKSSQYTFIIPHRVIQLTTISFWVSETRLRLPQVNK